MADPLAKSLDEIIAERGSSERGRGRGGSGRGGRGRAPGGSSSGGAGAPVVVVKRSFSGPTRGGAASGRDRRNAAAAPYVQHVSAHKYVPCP